RFQALFREFFAVWREIRATDASPWRSTPAEPRRRDPRNPGGATRQRPPQYEYGAGGGAGAGEGGGGAGGGGRAGAGAGAAGAAGVGAAGAGAGGAVGADGAAAGAAVSAAGVAACQIPPNPFPLACPGALSPAKRYSGRPSTVTCMAPSERVMTPTLPVTPAPTLGAPVTVSAGHSFAHAALHALVPPPGVSLSNTYSVRPDASTRTPPRGEGDSAMVAVDDAADEGVAFGTVEGAVRDTDDPHAARKTAAPAAASARFITPLYGRGARSVCRRARQYPRLRSTSFRNGSPATSRARLSRNK